VAALDDFGFFPQGDLVFRFVVAADSSASSGQQQPNCRDCGSSVLAILLNLAVPGGDIIAGPSKLYFEFLHSSCQPLVQAALCSPMKAG
jgi:hypothetical protein